MSDLQCPCRLVVAAHAGAEESGPGGDPGLVLTPAGRHQARVLADSLRNRRVAAIVSGSRAPSMATAEYVASELALPVRVRAGLDTGVAGETDDDVVRRAGNELSELADLYRGETVLVVTDAPLMSLVLPHLADNLRPEHARVAPLSPGAVVEIDADSDGWRCRSWAHSVL
jgi:broad specificity phosphatase PhoE